MSAAATAFLDSASTDSKHHLLALRQWFFAAHEKVTGNALLDADWTDVVPEVPQQNNDYDCGVFVGKMSECIMNGVELTPSRGGAPYQQSQMPDVRQHMVLSVIHGKVE